MKNLFFIHGAWSSGMSFRYFEKNLRYDNVHEVFLFKYDCNIESFRQILKRAKEELAKSDRETVIVGHSMGGLIALGLHDEPQCNKIITLASPLSGLEIPLILSATLAQRAPILVDIGKKSIHIKDIKNINYTKPIHSFITTKGFNPMIMEKSDGVVTISSQEDWLPATAISSYLKCNHFEVLQQDEVVDAINRYTHNGMA